MNNTKLFVILGNQLFNPNKYINNIKEYDFFISEDFGLCNYVRHHKLKILHVLSSMRSYKDELLKLGVNVNYLKIEDSRFYEDYFSKLKKYINKKKYKKVFFFEIEGKFFEEKLKKSNLGIEIEIIRSPMFLIERNEFKNLFSDKKKPLMANFYKYSRKVNNILMENNSPLGRKWSFDEENRKSIPKDLKIPYTNFPNKTKHTLELIPIIEKVFKNNIGLLSYFWIPTTRKDALKFLEDFLKNIFQILR